MMARQSTYELIILKLRLLNYFGIWVTGVGNAYGMQRAKGEYVVVCNDDVEVERTWLAEMVKVMEEDNFIAWSLP